eukprot:1452826-Rhodomonas_salina.2
MYRHPITMTDPAVVKKNRSLLPSEDRNMAPRVLSKRRTSCRPGGCGELFDGRQAEGRGDLGEHQSERGGDNVCEVELDKNDRNVDQTRPPSSFLSSKEEEVAVLAPVVHTLFQVHPHASLQLQLEEGSWEGRQRETQTRGDSESNVKKRERK